MARFLLKIIFEETDRLPHEYSGAWRRRLNAIKIDNGRILTHYVPHSITDFVGVV